MLERLECKCGGNLRKDGKHFICEYCDSLYLISADDKGELFAYQPVEKKHIQTGQIAAKATAINVNEIIVRQIKLDEDIETQVAQESVDLDKRNRISLIEGYLTTGDWEKVDEHVNGLLWENKDCSEAKWYSWMSEKKANDEQKMLSKLASFSQADGIRLDQLLQYASPAFANHIISLFFDGAFANDNMCYHALSVILPYARNKVIYSKQQLEQKVRTAFDRVIDKAFERSFNYLLENTLRSEEVDAYISYLSRFADKCNAHTSLAYYEKALAVDPSNLSIHRKLIRSDIESDALYQKTISDIERLISYSDTTDLDVITFVNQLCEEPKTTNNKSEVMWGLLSYHSAAPEGLKAQLLSYGHVLLESKLWPRAKDFFNLVLSFDVRCGDAYWGLCLVQMEARNDRDAVSKKEPIKSFSAYDKALAVYNAAGNTQKVSYLKSLSENQKSKQTMIKYALIAGAAVLAIILIIFISGKISHARKYSVNNIELELVNTESVQEPITEIDIQVKNGCRKDLSGMDISLRFYDSEKTLICSTSVHLSGLMVSKDKGTFEIKLHNSVIEELYWYSFEELKIAVSITYIRFNDYHSEDLGEGEERVLKNAQKPDRSKTKELEQKLMDAFAAFNEADISDSDFEEQTTAFTTVMDEIWKDVSRNQTLLETMYGKADEYQKDAQYEKAYFVFALLESVGYKDSGDKASECAMSIPY